MRERSRPVIVGLDVLRFAAALLVMLYHFGAASWADPTTEGARIVGGAVAFPELFHATWSGWVGVEIFFVISGLVIAYSAEGASPYRFFRSRVLRLYPAAWICGTLTLVVLAGMGFHHLARPWAASMTLFPLKPWIDSVYWTLGIEMAFYALIFVLLAANQYRRLELAAWLLGGLSSAYWICGGIFAPDFLRAHLWSRPLELSLLPYGCFFALGSMTYLASRHGVSLSRLASIALCLVAGCIEIAAKTDYNNLIFHAHETALQPCLIFLGAMACVFASMRLELKNAGIGHALRLMGLATCCLGIEISPANVFRSFHAKD